ncbi:MAG: tripartite tricarboxylate transporter TctB family protein [Chloroflexi bacterium]|nr:tripartite tricarboxylate transporter TctB family protein [Chloroflexota bacterium]
MIHAFRRPHLYVGLVSAAVGGLMLSQAWGTALFAPGLGTTALAFPLVVGLCLVAVGVLIGVRALLGLDPGQPVAWPDRRGWTRLLGLVVFTCLYVLLLETLGFLLSNIVVGAATVGLLGHYRWWVTALIAVGVAVGAWAVFEALLGVNLPRGIVPALIWGT